LVGSLDWHFHDDLGNVPGFHQLEVGEYPGKRLGGRFHQNGRYLIVYS
jgi:hypothetical protein